MRLLVLLLVLVLLAVVVYALARAAVASVDEGARRRRRWRADSRTRDDGTLVVSVRRGDEPPRVVRELPPGMDTVEFQAELTLALEQAREQADALNRER